MTQARLNFSEHQYLSLVKSLDRMLSVLSDGRWYRSKELVEILRISDRRVRQVAEFSQGQIVSGQRGYCLTRCAANEDIDHCEAWLISQGRKMIDRAREIRIARNRGGSAAA